VDITGQTVFASATNLDEVDVTGQTVFASATNLDEVTAVTIGAVSAYNMYDVDVQLILMRWI